MKLAHTELLSKVSRHPVYDNRPPERIKCGDIDDTAILLIVEAFCRLYGMWTNTTAVVTAVRGLPYGESIPENVIAAKLSRLLRRGLLAGCDCGCRGDWEVTDAGRALIASAPWHEGVW